MKFLLVFLVICFFAIPGSAQIRHGQVITSFAVHEQESAVSQKFPGAGELALREDQLYIGQCGFQRGNATRKNWKSYVHAFPMFFAKNLFVALDKFPKTLNHTAEVGSSSAHPNLIVDKSRVGVARFYFEPETPDLDEHFKIPVPTDIFDMTINKISSRISYVGNITTRTGLQKFKGHTSYVIRVRFDAPNSITRKDTVHYTLIETQLAYYAKKDNSEWSEPLEQKCNQNSVGYATKTLRIPNKWEKAGKFELKVQLERRVWTEPIGELAQWGGWEKDCWFKYCLQSRVEKR